MSTIFVEIAAFADDELYKTVVDCINKSSGENTIFFGIHECYIDNKTIFDIDNVRIKYSKAPDNLGVGIGRYIANSLYKDEDYYLQIDCHSRFKKDWDIKLINNLNKYISLGMDCILTAYPPRYKYNQDGSEWIEYEGEPQPIVIKRNDLESFKKDRIYDQEAKYMHGDKCTYSVSNGMIFGPGSISKVRHNPAIYIYNGEEALRAASLYTNGYNLMVPDESVIFHLYGSDTNRKSAWKEFPEVVDSKKAMSDSAVYSIFSKNLISSTELGSKRPLEWFGNLIAVDFINGIIY